MSQFSLYRNEIFHFLQTVTIKFEQLGILLNRELQYTYTIDEDDKTSWPYYLHMIGEYHESDTMMYIPSIDTGETVPFTKETLLTHPKTAQLYKPGRDRYNDLLITHPTQKDLIKSIVYPVKDMQTAIEAEDFTLLAYDDTFLEVGERYDLIEHLNNFLEYNSQRWYIQEFNYEELHPIAFWAILFYMLPATMFARRLENVHTSSVHSFHVWEYLISKGLGDYRDILTLEQSLFLYRNINYLYKNKGKKSNLLILADNLLRSLRVSVVGKMIYHNNADTQDTCLWIPEILSDPIVDYDDNAPDVDTSTFNTILEINNRMFNEGLERENDTEHVDSVEQQLSLTQRNILNTKLVEIKKYVIDNKYENILVRFILDSFMRWVLDGKLNFTINVTEENAGILLEDLPLQDALLLMHYCTQKYHMMEPVELPRFYTANTGYRSFTKPEDIPKTFKYFNDTYTLTNHIKVDEMVDDIPWIDYDLNQTDFLDHMANQFIALVKHIRYIRSSSNKLVHLSVAHLYNELIPVETMDINFSNAANYQEWIQSVQGVGSIIDHFEQISNNEYLYQALALNIMEQILPLTNDKFKPYITANDSNTSRLYTRLKELFVQLCSYNITFLDTQRDSATYMFLSNLPVDPCGLDEATENAEFDLQYDNIVMDLHHQDDLDVDVEALEVGLGDIEYGKENVEVEPSTDMSMTLIEEEKVNLFNETIDNQFKEMPEKDGMVVDITAGMAFSEIN